MTSNYKPHDDIEIDYYPQELIDVQRELMHPAHIGLWVRLNSKHEEELASSDMLGRLVIIATEMDIPLDGEYTAVEVAQKILARMREERIKQESIVFNSTKTKH